MNARGSSTRNLARDPDKARCTRKVCLQTYASVWTRRTSTIIPPVVRHSTPSASDYSKRWMTPEWIA